MFKIIPDHIVKAWPAVAQVPVTGGQVEEQKFTLDLQLIDSDEFNQASRGGDTVLLSRVVKGWSGIGDAAGSELPFTPDNLRALVKNPVFAKAAFSAYMQAVSGQAAEKN